MLGFKFHKHFRRESDGVEFGQLVIQPLQSFGMVAAIGKRADFSADVLPVAHDCPQCRE